MCAVAPLSLFLVLICFDLAAVVVVAGGGQVSRAVEDDGPDRVL